MISKNTLRTYLWPLVKVKRWIDRKHYETSVAIADFEQSIRDSLSIQKRLDNHSTLNVGVRNFPSRDLWVRQVLAKIPPGSLILDAGAGEQQYRKYCDHLSYFSQDNSAYDGKGDGIGAHVDSWSYGSTDYVCDIIDIPVPNCFFDAVLCTEVFEHLPDPLLALKELTRILKPGGTLILTAPFCSFTHFSPYFYSTGFSRQWYIHHLQRMHFSEMEFVANGNYFEYLAQEVRRLPIMAHAYAHSREPWRIRLCMLLLLKFLQTCSAQDDGSNDFCCFGWHVKAKKELIQKEMI